VSQQIRISKLSTVNPNIVPKGHKHVLSVKNIKNNLDKFGKTLHIISPMRVGKEFLLYYC